VSTLLPTIHNPDWALFIAHYFRISYQTARELLANGRLPAEDRLPRDPKATRIYQDAPAIAELERFRAQFDTPLAEYIRELDRVAGDLLDGRTEQPHEHALAEFRFYTPGLDAAYPLTPRHRPWRNMRAPVTRAELEAAGYRELAACWDRPDLDAFRARGGECRIGPQKWAYWSGTVRPDLRVPRGAFLARLAHVLSKRVKS
jgi:hypothetical protein